MSLAAVDITSFVAANFQPEYCARNDSCYLFNCLDLQFNMDDDEPDTIVGFRRSLEQSREKIETDLQRTVQHRLGDLLQATRELSGFESKMSELHAIINQLTSLSETLLANVPQISGEAAAAAAVAEEAADAAPTMAAPTVSALPVAGVDMVERRNKVNILLEHVEGVDELFDEATGRYIVFETGGGDVQMAMGTVAGGKNAAKPISLYVLNDGLMATGKKASRNPLGQTSKRKSIVEIWLPFTELHYEDVKSTEVNALKIRGDDTDHSWILIFESLATKRLWLDQIKRAVIAFKMEEAASNATLHLQPVKERFVKKATRSGLARASGHRRAASSTAARKAAEHAVASAAATADLPDDRHRSLLGMLDGLQQASALRAYDEATELMMQVEFNLEQLVAAGFGDAPRLHSVRKALDSSRRELANLLLTEIACPLAKREDTVKYVQILHVLHYQDAARERFLAARSQVIRNVTRGLFSVGTAVEAAGAIAEATCEAIRATAGWYREAFAEPVRIAGLAFWTRMETTRFCGLLAKLIFTGSLEPVEIGEAMDSARKPFAQLTDIGLSLTVLFDDCLTQPLSDYLEDRLKPVNESLLEAIEKDPLEETVALDQVPVPLSTRTIDESIRAFADEWLPVLSSGVSNALAVHLDHLLESTSSAYVSRFANAGPLRPVIVAACEHIASHLFGHVYGLLLDRYQQDYPVLLKLQNRLMSGIYAMYDILVEVTAALLLPTQWDCYQSSGSGLSDEASTSPWVMQTLPQMSRVVREAPAYRRPHLLAHLAKSVIAHLTKATDEGSVKFTHCGMEQLSLDLGVLNQAWSIQDQHLYDAIDQLMYRASHMAGVDRRSRPDDWFTSRARQLIEASPPAITNFGIND